MRRKRRLKKKVKRIFLTIFVLFIIIIVGIVVSSSSKHDNQNKQTKKNKITIDDKLENTCRKLDYCYKKYMKRYKKYYEANHNLELSDVIIRVNLNLDYDFYTHTKKTPYLNKDYVLVNKYLYLGENYTPNNLEIIPEEYARSGMKLVKSANDAFIKMARAAREDDKKIIAMSSYRSYNYQVNLYNKYKEADGEEKADTYSGRAGFSEHQTGLCVDIYDGELDYTNFEKSASFSWMKDNAYKYGFILRFPKGKENITGYQYESWHYRYVGKKAATYIYENNITFEEYYIQYIENKY